MDIQDVIRTKRDGRKHSRAELDALISATAGTAPDYQLAAWLMAAYLKGLDHDETAWLTLAMAHSGERLDLTALPKPWIDKHSTGGVGDKTTIVLLPMLAACGLSVVKMSGRGLGITGGTYDKLAAVPGFRLDLSPEDLVDQAARIGLAISGQTPNLAPADKVLYALRDATTTVDSIPLIVSSILSKKIAGGAETVVLDVKSGSGAFMKTLETARDLAHALQETAHLAGLKTRIAITDMSQPLGRTVGAALEVEEAAAVLRGHESSRFTDLCVELCALALVAAGATWDMDSGRERATQALIGGAALAKAQAWFAAQGADPAVLIQPDSLPQAEVRHPIHAPADGWIAGIDAATVGEIVIDLGGGRHAKEDEIDPAVGVEIHTEVGKPVRAGETISTIHARERQIAEICAAKLAASIQIAPIPIAKIDPIIEILAEKTS